MIDAAYIPIVLVAVLLLLFVWNRWRYDLVAIFGLLCAVALGIVSVENAFLGFGHPAVVLVAAALVISAGLKSSGALQAIMGSLPVEGKSLWLQLLIICGVTAMLSAFINNVAAVALMIPFVVRLAYNSKRSVRLYLMPLAFASLLGGLMTLIGTPPNIIIATYRAHALGVDRFKMFDFAPVGIIACLGGIIFISIFSRFFIKVSKNSEGALLNETRDFLTDLQIGEKSPLIGITVREFMEMYPGCNLYGVKRASRPFIIPSQFERLESGDYLIMEATSEVLETLISKEDLILLGKDNSLEISQDEDATIAELVVPADSFAVGRSSKFLDLRWKYSVKIDVLEKLDPKKISRSQGHVHPDGNPHFWMSPVHMIQAARVVTHHLKLVRPSRSEFFESNFQKTQLRLVALNAELKKMFDDIPNRYVLEYHKEFSYFFDAVGLMSLGTLEALPGVRPNTNRIKEIAELAKNTQVKLLLAASWDPKNDLDKFKTESPNVTVLQRPSSLPSGQDYIEFQRSWGKKISQVLSNQLNLP